MLPESTKKGGTPHIDQVLSEDIIDRLQRIVFHLEERERIRKELPSYSGRDYHERAGEKGKAIARIITRLQVEEIDLLSELTHLLDNVRKYLRASGKDPGELCVVERSRVFRVASNLVNTYKHGTRGRNQKCAKIDYYFMIAERRKEVAEIDDPILDVISIVNLDGELFPAPELIDDLIQIWEIFLRNHTSLDFREFRQKFSALLLRRVGKSLYTAAIPEGIKVHADSLAKARKHLDIR